MKRYIDIRTIMLFSLLAIAGSSCLQDECTETRAFIRFEPVYRTAAQITAPISVESPRPLVDPGIIYFYDGYILINEFREGIHVFDNSDPSNPVPVSFINIEGNEHFAIQSDQLQANKFNALLTIDISDVQHPEQKSVISNAFKEIHEQPGRGFLVYHRQTDQTQTLNCSDPNFNSLRWHETGGGGGIFVDVLFAAESADLAVRDQSGGTGTGGSTARFTITNQHLYIVSEHNLKVFDLHNPSRPSETSTVNLGWGIETIYPFQDRLFIGSNSGMFIYDVTTPSDPTLVSSFEHARACDPVVADSTTAYVTLRDGTMCEGFSNQLDVIDVTDINYPQLLDSYGMKNPHGLALQGDYLYVCEGDHGLRVMDVSDRTAIKEVGFHLNIAAIDVIALPDRKLLVIGKGGFFQYDATDPLNLSLLSTIPVVDEI
ncbi:MAG: hypothetical protein HKN87_08985 [Saprospiraceae bacterium]|nr:hypothetical protein [Saprospiraceae bacterium]